MDASLTTPRSIGKIAKCIVSVFEKCQDKCCPISVAVATPLSSPTGLAYLYAVMNNRTMGSSASAGANMNSSEGSVSSTVSEGEYIVKSRTKPCWFHGGRRGVGSSDVQVSERAIRAALRDTLSPEMPSLSNSQSSGALSSVVIDPRAPFEGHLRYLRCEIQVYIAYVYLRECVCVRVLSLYCCCIFHA